MHYILFVFLYLLKHIYYLRKKNLRRNGERVYVCQFISSKIYVMCQSRVSNQQDV